MVDCLPLAIWCICQVLQTVTFTGYKIAHLSDYTKEFDMEAWSADLKVLD